MPHIRPVPVQCGGGGGGGRRGPGPILVRNGTPILARKPYPGQSVPLSLQRGYSYPGWGGGDTPGCSPWVLPLTLSQKGHRTWVPLPLNGHGTRGYHSP